MKKLIFIFVIYFLLFKGVCVIYLWYLFVYKVKSNLICVLHALKLYLTLLTFGFNFICSKLKINKMKRKKNWKLKTNNYT